MSSFRASMVGREPELSCYSRRPLVPRKKQSAIGRGKVQPTGDQWTYRKLVALAIQDAQTRLKITQAELAEKVGVKREVLLHARMTRIPKGEIAPINQLSLRKSRKLARLAGWDDGQLWEMTSAWLEETKMRSEPDHIGTLQLLSPEVRRQRWKELHS